jgi:hypothetical protein
VQLTCLEIKIKVSDSIKGVEIIRGVEISVARVEISNPNLIGIKLKRTYFIRAKIIFNLL